MHGVDDNSGDDFGPSRTDMRREALAVRELAERLVEQPPARLQQLPLADDLLVIVLEAQRITAQIAHKRQVGFLAKKLRREDDDTLLALRAALEHDKADSRREAAALHRVEALREQLIDGGDAELGDLVSAYPRADRQRLRQLVRNAREEKLRNKPPHSYRELFRELRDLLGPNQAAGDEP